MNYLKFKHELDRTRKSMWQCFADTLIIHLEHLRLK